jgi:AAA+ superfamily predicted ATPase
MPVSPPLHASPDADRAGLLERVAAVKLALARHAGLPLGPEASPPQSLPGTAAEYPPALERIAAGFGLSNFECDTLLLCAGMELSPELPALCATAQGDPSRAYPTFALALAALPEPHWSALSPDGPLRHWRLVEVGAGQVLTAAPLRIDERVLHFLAGVAQRDERLAALLEPLPATALDGLVPSQAVVAERAADAWAGAPRGRELPLVQLSGAIADCRPIAAAAAGLIGLGAAVLPAERLPNSAADLDTLLRLWEREAMLSDLGVLLLECPDTAPAEAEPGHARAGALELLLERATGPVILREREPRRIAHRPSVVLDVPHPTAAERLAIWRESLGPAAAEDPDLAAAAAQFNLSVLNIRAIAAEARTQLPASPPAASGLVWDLSRHRLRSALDGLAHRIESKLTWDDLVLPEPQKATLRIIAAQLRQRATVHDQWGFAEKSSRGLGLSALFHGPTGTGKTMAAEVLAGELRLDLYHIDLSRVVSKYIGETEANLRRVFDAAEENGAILLFDEADSLFGTRSEVKDSHDRYANIEVSYLLQRMEAYRGLAILTTNMRGALDQAFRRRIRFAVQFPFPDAPQREAIWAKVFPEVAPTRGLEPRRLSRLRLAGGNIRNIALNAAFLAAEAGEDVQMHHLRRAADAEFAKLDRRPSSAENETWA